jgi:hypothetical protein
LSYKVDLENITTGSNDATNFGSGLLRLVMKADLFNMALLRRSFPNAVKTVEEWRETEEIPDLPYDGQEYEGKVAVVHAVDIEAAQAGLDFTREYVAANLEKVKKAEAAAMEPLMGLILTAVYTGLVSNATPRTTELRDKIFMAFDMGFIHGELHQSDAK